MYQGSSNSWH